MPFRGFQEIYKSIENQISSRRPGLSTRPNDFHGEAFIAPVSSEIELLYQELEQNRASKSVLTATGTDLEELGANFKIFKTSSTSSSGIVSVGTDVLPLTDKLIPAGTIFTGVSGANTVTYFSLTDVILPSQAEFASFPENSPYAILNQENLLVFAVDVPIRATTTGTVTNADLGAIRSAINLDNSFNQIYNYSTVTGGTDEMTESELSSLISLALAGGLVGTENGYLLSALLQPEVSDSKVVGFGQFGMIRDGGKGGCIDVVVIGENLVQVEQTFENVNTLDDLELAFNPVVLISSVTGESSGQISQFAYTLIQESDNDPRLNSTQSRSKIRWTLNTPVGDTIVVKYVYNKTVTDILDRIKSRMGNPGVNLLVKTANVLFVDVEMLLTLSGDADRGQVKSQAETTIRNTLNSLALGEQLTQSKLVQVVKSSSTQILDVVIPLRKLAISGSVGTGTVSPQPSEYIRAGNVQVYLQ